MSAWRGSVVVEADKVSKEEGGQRGPQKSFDAAAAAAAWHTQAPSNRLPNERTKPRPATTPDTQTHVHLAGARLAVDVLEHPLVPRAGAVAAAERLPLEAHARDLGERRRRRRAALRGRRRRGAAAAARARGALAQRRDGVGCSGSLRVVWCVYVCVCVSRYLGVIGGCLESSGYVRAPAVHACGGGRTLGCRALLMLLQGAQPIQPRKTFRM